MFSHVLKTVVLLATLFELSLASRRITLNDGVYNGITVAIHEQVQQKQCYQIISYFTKELLPRFSTMLLEATNNLSSIGQITILLPSTHSCGLSPAQISTADPYDTYDSSHLQITPSDPFTEFLPHTLQYGTCGHPSSSITIPTSFLSTTPTLNETVKSKLLVHEWTKFRYGVFDEIAYDDDSHFSGCYTKDGQAHFTTCSDSKTLSAIGLNETACTYDFLNSMHYKIEDYVSNGKSSLLSLPHINSVTKFCDKSTHNTWAQTKQNLYCHRRSVSEIVFSHPDFKSNAKQTEPPIPQVKFVRHSRTYNAGYVFAIEDSDDMRSTYKLRYVKQALAQLFRVLSYTEVIVFLYSKVGMQKKSNGLANENQKLELLRLIPDPGGSTMTSFDSTEPFNISTITIEILKDMNDMVSWSIFYFTSGTSDTYSDIQSATRQFKETSVPLTVFTFGNDAIWLLWNSLPNTRNVISLPNCRSSYLTEPCSYEPSRLILKQMIGIVNSNQLRQATTNRFIHTPVQSVLIPNTDSSVQFPIDHASTKSIYMFVAIPDIKTSANDYISVLTPSGNPCTIEYTFQYRHLLTINCGLESGNYTVQVDRLFPQGTPQLYMTVLTEPLFESSLSITQTLGIPDTTVSMYPNERVQIPVYVGLTDLNTRPLLNARVSVRVLDTSVLTATQITPTTMFLLDNGDTDNGADKTKNDGVYSGFLRGFSSNGPAYHVVVTEVEVTEESRFIKNISNPKAMVLQDLLSKYCCGKTIFPETIDHVKSSFRIETLHVGFRTHEALTTKHTYAGQVSNIVIKEETDVTISISFKAVVGDMGGNTDVLTYQACCILSYKTGTPTSETPGDSSCKQNTADCGVIVNAYEVQNCTLNKSILLNKWVGPESWDLVNGLVCGIRAVNKVSSVGEVSSRFFNVNLDAVIETAKSEVQRCDKFSIEYKCLPLWIFWVVIGCLGLLVLIIIIMCICLCVCSNRNTSNKKRQEVKENVLAVHYSPPPPRPSESDNEESSKVVKELFVNHAYIQERDGEIKIIADNGQILRKPKPEGQERSVVFPPQPPAPRFISPKSIQQDTQVFKPVLTPKTNPNVTRPPSRTKVNRDRIEIVHPNVNLKSDSSQYDRRVGNINDPSVVYASIHTSRLRTPTKQVSFDPHYMVPAVNIPQKQVISSEPRITPSPPQLPQYPTYTETSSSSEYEDRFIPTTRPKRVPPRFTKPPAYPVGSRIVQQQVPDQKSKGSKPSNPPPPVPPPRFDRSHGIVTPAERPASASTYGGVKSEVMYIDDDSDQWDDGYEIDATTGASYA